MTDLIALSAQIDDAIAILRSVQTQLRTLSDADEDVWTVARAIQGEGAALFPRQRDELGAWIAHTAYNRWTKPWWRHQDGREWTLAERTAHDFHGTANVTTPAPWALHIAHEVLSARRAGMGDITGGCLFMLSLVDLRVNGWIERARHKAVRVFKSTQDGGHQFWFFRDWLG